MYTYSDSRGTIHIDFKKGCICSFEVSGNELTACACLPLFSVRFRNTDGSATEVNALEGTLISFSGNSKKAEALYGFEGADIRLTVNFGKDYWAEWRINVNNRSEAAVEWVDYVQIPLKREYDSQKAMFYWPYNEGVQIDDLDLRERSGWESKETEFPGLGSYALFPGMVESQFVAYELHEGLYLGAHDPVRGLKNIDIEPGDGYARLKLRIYAGKGFGEDYSPDFEVVTELFSGGWTAATEIYRRWFDANLPLGLKRVCENSFLPEWYNDSPIIVTYPVRGLHDMDRLFENRLFPYENALPRIDELAEKLNTRIMVLLMHWEGTAPWAPPFVWPPYGGEAMLRGFADKLHVRGHLLGVYLSGIGFTVQSNLDASYNCETLMKERGYDRDLCLSPNGELIESRICTGQRRGYDMCPMGKDTADIVYKEVRSMAEAGIDYAQTLDQNHGGNPYFCYSRTHGHAPVPGAWMTQSMNALLEKAVQAGKGMLFGCESAAGEPFLAHLPLSDLRFNLGWIYGKPVPMFAYLYHEYLHNFMGNQVCAGDTFVPDTESLAYRLAYSFTAGDLPTLVLTDDGRIMQAWGDRQFDILPDEDQVLALIRSMIDLRRNSGRKYLCGGRMIESVAFTCLGTRTFRMKTLYKNLDVPCVLTSRWRAQDGSEAQLLVNWTRNEVECTLDGKEIIIPGTAAMLSV